MSGEQLPDQFCQIYKVVDDNGVTREFRMPDKLRAAQLLAQRFALCLRPDFQSLRPRPGASLESLPSPWLPIVFAPLQVST